MRQPAVEQLATRAGGRYAATTIVAARARQLIDGDVPAVDTDAMNPVLVAMEELARGRLRTGPREGLRAREDVPAAVGEESTGAASPAAVPA